MNLVEQLNADLRAAMRSGDEPRKNALRQVLAGIRQAELEKRTAAAKQQPRQGDLTPEQRASLGAVRLDEAEVLAAIEKEAKARRESIADAEKAGRADLVAANQAELRIIQGYLPQPLSRAEIEALARSAISETGATDIRQLGAVMKVLTPRTRGRAEGRVVNDVVRELLSGRP